MQFELIISGGTIVFPGEGMAAADLAIESGKVAAILPRGHGATASREIDATGRFLFPGVVDCHVHVDLGPGEERWRESHSAALGGVTTMLSYLLTSRPYDQVFPQELAKAEADSIVDFGFHFSLVTAEQVSCVDRFVRDYGVTSFKHFTNFRGNAGAYLGLKGTDDGHFWSILEVLKRYPQTVLAVHPENQDILEALTPRLQARGRDDLAAYTESRPNFVEAIATQSALYMAYLSGSRVYVPHITSALSLQVYEQERARNDRIYAETCPHYLTHDMYSSVGTRGKVNPPLRTQGDIEALWNGIKQGVVEVVASDHVPRRLDKKAGGIWKASAGFPGTATLFPVMLSEGHHRRGLSLDRVAQLVCRRPAEIFGLYPQKGTLRPGSDGDVAIVDLDLARTVKAGELGSFSDYSLYEGCVLKGWPVQTLVRGRTVMSEGRIADAEAHGCYLRR